MLLAALRVHVDVGFGCATLGIRAVVSFRASSRRHLWAMDNRAFGVKMAQCAITAGLYQPVCVHCLSLAGLRPKAAEGVTDPLHELLSTRKPEAIVGDGPLV